MRKKSYQNWKNELGTPITFDDVLGRAQGLTREMVSDEKDRRGCLERAAYAVARRTGLSLSKIHKLRRGYRVRLWGEEWENLKRAYALHLDAQEAGLDARAEYLKRRRADLYPLTDQSSDTEFYQAHLSADRRRGDDG